MEAESVQNNMNGKTKGMAKTAAPATTPTQAMAQPSADGSMSMQGGIMEKMPFLKKWWFWVIVGAVVIGLAFVWFFVL
ncbi:MAG: hypothetical protein OQK82_08685 [Candidatus Pacearchaeota archaeon]|nr:hypothetical protein [Candidatus Pacearchaeota archaeon]